MRACAMGPTVLCAIVLASACSSGPSQPAASPDVAPSTSASAAASDAKPVAAPEPPKATPKPDLRTAAACKELAADLVNEPDGGVAVSNAVATHEGGDRFVPLTELVRSKRDAFRCCFDIWAKQNRGQSGSVKMVVKLKPDGTLTNVSFADTEGRLKAPEVEACMGDVAKNLKYPKSPTGKETVFTYPFDFKAHH